MFSGSISLAAPCLVFARTQALLMVTPLFGDSTLVLTQRTLLAVAITAALVPMVALPVEGMSFSALTMGVGGEILIGLTLGFLVKISFEAIIMAASLVGYQMGFGTATLLMPASADAQVSAFTAMHRVLVGLIILGMNLHYTFLFALVESFRLLPPLAKLGDYLVNLSSIEVMSRLFLISLQLASPILVALLLSTAALGLMARAVPSLNVFTLSFPLSFFVGLTTYLAMVHMLPPWLEAFYWESIREICTLLHRKSLNP